MSEHSDIQLCALAARSLGDSEVIYLDPKYGAWVQTPYQKDGTWFNPLTNSAQAFQLQTRLQMDVAHFEDMVIVFMPKGMKVRKDSVFLRHHFDDIEEVSRRAITLAAASYQFAKERAK